jgi:endoglucanase
MLKKTVFLVFSLFFFFCQTNWAQNLQLDSSGYFKNQGVNVMAFDDIYPEGHQGGVGVIMHGNRVATNGDIRLEATPGQWQPVPKQIDRKLNIKENLITVKLCYPDSSRNKKGFNPVFYPELQFYYTIKIKGEGPSVKVTVDLDRPIPEEFIGKVGFNFELFPGSLMGKTWIMDNTSGIFPTQPNGGLTVLDDSYKKETYNPINADEIIAQPYAVGKKLTVQPDDIYNKVTIESKTGNLMLLDGRMNHNNGWFVVRSEVAPGATKNAIEWIITPNAVDGWLYEPVVQISQLGYHPLQGKEAIIELDGNDKKRNSVQLEKITSEGTKLVKEGKGKEWGRFLRYDYLKFDFSDVKEEGLYQIVYGNSKSSIFRIDDDIYTKGAWQPVLEYFLPVQMCHMKIYEKYRVWHGLCHMDDALMAPVDHNHFDGYRQGSSTLTKYKPGDSVPELNKGGWHDAGDYDLRVESQSGEIYILSLAHEEFNVDFDETTIDQTKHVTEIHQPDGKLDILQQIEHGALTVLSGYKSLGRLYRGIICNNLRQYVMLGDAASMTDNVIGNEDDRWVFTEKNPYRELSVSAHLAAVSRVLKSYNVDLSNEALNVAVALFDSVPVGERLLGVKLQAATELLLTTKEQKYKDFILSNKSYIAENIMRTGWFIGRADKLIGNKKFSKEVEKVLQASKSEIEKLSNETPYGVPYKPHIWGAGWGIQALGFRYYFVVKDYPEIFEPDMMFNALNFVLGSHPGKNTNSFASGIGTNSVTVAYGVNRGDWSFIPGGVISGTNLVRPDFPELLEFPFIWQQTEYVLGGGSSNFMFLVLAAKKLTDDLKGKE